MTPPPPLCPLGNECSAVRKQAVPSTIHSLWIHVLLIVSIGLSPSAPNNSVSYLNSILETAWQRRDWTGFIPAAHAHTLRRPSHVEMSPESTY